MSVTKSLDINFTPESKEAILYGMLESSRDTLKSCSDILKQSYEGWKLCGNKAESIKAEVAHHHIQMQIRCIEYVLNHYTDEKN